VTQKVYAIPYAFDSIGIIYDKDKVNPPPDTMEVLWDAKYQGKVLAYDNGEHNFSFTALTMGIADPFHLSADDMAKVKDKLIALKANVLSFYTTPDEALQLYKDNDVALIWANYGQQQVKAMLDAGANIGYVNEGRCPGLARHLGLASGVQDKDLAEAWVNFVIEEDQPAALRAPASAFGGETGSAAPGDKLVWLQFVEDPTKRSDLWNEIKTAP
jgi:putative spermidine/putrescine transport system substrate-binding protein